MNLQSFLDEMGVHYRVSQHDDGVHRADAGRRRARARPEGDQAGRRAGRRGVRHVRAAGVVPGRPRRAAGASSRRTKCSLVDEQKLQRVVPRLRARRRAADRAAVRHADADGRVALRRRPRHVPGRHARGRGDDDPGRLPARCAAGGGVFREARVGVGEAETHEALTDEHRGSAWRSAFVLACSMPSCASSTSSASAASRSPPAGQKTRTGRPEKPKPRLTTSHVSARRGGCRCTAGGGASRGG